MENLKWKKMSLPDFVMKIFKNINNNYLIFNIV